MNVIDSTEVFLTTVKKDLVSIRYKLEITPKEILFIDHANGRRNVNDVTR